jgi:ribosomal protein S6
MNKRYELVVVIDPVLTADQMSALKAKIVETIGNVLDTDDMGLPFLHRYSYVQHQ